MTRVGFTGSRGDNNAGMTEAQRAAFVRVFGSLVATEFHHGCAAGSDEQAAWLVDDTDWGRPVRIVGHPGYSARESIPSDPGQQDHGLGPRDETRTPQTHFARNRAIVAACDLLVAAPSYPGPITKATKGGTAMTLNHARKMGKPVIIVWPDGSTTEEGPT